MRILFDVNVPAQLALSNHEIVRAGEMGWADLQNGVVLRAAEDAGFDLLLTCDRNIRFQQNLHNRTISVLIVSTNHWPTIRVKTLRITAALEFIQRCQVVEVDMAD